MPSITACMDCRLVVFDSLNHRLIESVTVDCKSVTVSIGQNRPSFFLIAYDSER